MSQNGAEVDVRYNGCQNARHHAFHYSRRRHHYRPH